MPRKIKGLRRRGPGWETYCRVSGVLLSARWPLDTPVAEMTDWLRTHRSTAARRRHSHKSFASDAELYLGKIRALPTFRQRHRHLELWAQVFHGKRRSAITSADIRAQRDRWLLDGFAPHTVNLRLRALSNMWTVLDGRRAPNPVREVPEAREPDAEPRAMPYWLAERIVEAFPPSLERVQAQLMITAGLAPVEIARLLPKHWQQGALFVQGRGKGAGGASRSVPLSTAATEALKAFSAWRGWERPPSKQFYRLFERARLRVAKDPLVIDEELRERLRTVDAINAYDLRHSYATKLYAETGDAHAAAYVLGHRSTSTTARYIKSALALRARHAVQNLEQKLDAEVGREAKAK